MRSLVMTFFVFPLLFFGSIHAEEYYFRFQITDAGELHQLTEIISIDNVDGRTVYAYANDKQLERFKKLKYRFEILPHPGSLIQPEMAHNTRDLHNWNVYPTYFQYDSMMTQFATDYPNLCRIKNAGLSVQFRKIMFAKISDNVQQEEDEPEVMFTSTMHGDETTGYVLMLRLIDYLLSNYGTDPQVTNLVDNCEIWINPLANPDGTYYGGNNTVYNARRYNANWVDLNRNFPDPQDGPHPDGHPWQPETIAMMNLATAHNFVISANFHGGAEVVNYPWDTWSHIHADNNWYIDICRDYADSAQAYSPPGYMNDLNNGITNGYAWYEVNGGRQDYMNYWQGCREVTIELSHTKLLPANQLPSHWNYNKASFLKYFENALYGIRGVVTDASTGQPLDAVVRVLAHDLDGSEVFTDPDVGDYHRMLSPGSYNLEFTAEHYLPDTVYNIAVTAGNVTVVNVQLQREIITHIDSRKSQTPAPIQLEPNYPNPFNPATTIRFTTSVPAYVNLKVFNTLGEEVKTLLSQPMQPGAHQVVFDGSALAGGIYYYRLQMAVRTEGTPYRLSRTGKLLLIK